MITIPEKLMKELEKLVQNKFVVTHRLVDGSTTIHGFGTEFHSEFGIEKIIDKTTSVITTSRPMIVADLFSKKECKKHLIRLQELEKKEQELEKLKSSIKTIKGVLE